MNRKMNVQATIALMLAGIVALGAGCASLKTREAGVERAEKTTTSMQAVDSEIKSASMQIDVVKASLESLIRTGQQPGAQPDNVKAAYETFTANADKMQDSGKNLNSHINEMSSQGNDYFEEWAKEGGSYTNPQIQKLSEERRSRLSDTFREMELATAGVRGNLNSYLSELEQVQTYLSNDLTPQGIAAISPVAQSVIQSGDKLKQSFAPVETAIMQARSELTPGGGAAAGGGQGAAETTEQKK
jgi:chromosome segregation ATPase